MRDIDVAPLPLSHLESHLDEAGVRPGPVIRCGRARQEQDDRNDCQNGENPDRQEDSPAHLPHNP